jgi:tetratricopeptide (TPR) repeat protein
MKQLVVFLLLAGAIGGVYYNAVGNGFVFDDYLLVVNHAAIPLVAADPMLAFSPNVLGYRPLRTLSYVLDYWIGGMQPWVFHLSNIFYHWIVACLVFLAVFRLVANETIVGGGETPTNSPEVSSQSSGFAWRVALFTAVLWAMHPIQTDAVTYISGRRDILTGLFFFLGLYAFLRFRMPSPERQTKRRTAWIGIAFLAYGLGLLSKEMAVTLPLVMLCYDYVHAVQLQEMNFGRKYVQELIRGLVRAVWKHKYLYFPLLAGGIFFSWYAAFVVLPAWRIGWYGGSIGTNFLTTARIWVHYLSLLLWPVRLLADYTGAFAVTTSLVDPWALAAVGLLVVLFLITLGLLRYSRLAAFSALWIPITLLPVSHIIPYPEMVAEHYLYIPSFGFCLLVALLLARLTESFKFQVSGFRLQSPSYRPPAASLWKPVMGYGLLALLLFFYAGRTMIRNRDWRDDLTFYNCMVRDNPYSARARLGLGYAYDLGGLPRMAIYQYTAGLRINPQDPRLLVNRGAALQKLGDLAQAERDYLASLKILPRYGRTWNNLGFLYTEKGEFDKARAFLRQAERFSDGRDYSVYANLGLLNERQGKLPEALEGYRKALRLNPTEKIFVRKVQMLETKLGQQGQNPENGAESGPSDNRASATENQAQ